MLIVNALTHRVTQHKKERKSVMEQLENGASVSSSPPLKDVVHLLIRVVKMHHCLIESQVSGLGVHHSQHRMLMHLSRYEKIPSQKDISDALRISPAAVAVTLKRLEKDGYIERSMTDEDNRKNEIRITDEGRRMVEVSRRIFESSDGAMFDGLSPEEISAFAGLLERMTQNLEKELSERAVGDGNDEESK